jgi:hydrogenase maturation protein HypF
MRKTVRSRHRGAPARSSPIRLPRVRDRRCGSIGGPAGPARLTVTIEGAVQGVGFRPFVHRLATELALSGWVVNDTRGVVIDVEGDRPILDQFLQRLPRERPAHAVVHELRAEWGEPRGYAGFQVLASDARGGRTASVLPDLATCPRCLAEIREPRDRHFRYPFTNCTHCGPRFTILQELPYDRPNTTMRGFAMCPACRSEYDDQRDRRFHAQPTACPACGPRLSFRERRSGEESWSETATDDEALRAAAAAIRAGRITAVKGLGGFHLIVDASNDGAVARLRARKRRPTKPLALMVADAAAAARLCVCSPEDEALLSASQAPIVLLPRREQSDDGAAEIADAVAPDMPILGVMLPATPLHHLLMAEVGRPVVATSGNRSDEPICIDEDEAMARLGDVADAFLIHDRPIVRHVDDSIVRRIANVPRVLRRARGYAPLPVLLGDAVPPILAVGGHFKNSIALSVGRQVFISQHIGDLETPLAMATFERVISDFLRLYETQPSAIACDLHPDYRSTHWAADAAARMADGCHLIPVQHHHAHFAACLAENDVRGPALGVIWDGTGYGLDGTIWGSEALVGNASGVRRFAHLRPFRLPGGDAAAREPRRAALALLYDTFGEAALAWDDLAPVADFDAGERRILAAMLGRGVNAPLVTSMGRLFDGVAALAGLTQRAGFEGEAAMALEAAADPGVGDAYPCSIEAGTPLLLDWRPVIAGVVGDVRRGRSPARIAARFHNTLAECIIRIAEAAGHEQVALSGGCFQNRLLVESTTQRLQSAGHTVLLHRQVPPNDGGISLGQIAVAAAHIADRK